MKRTRTANLRQVRIPRCKKSSPSWTAFLLVHLTGIEPAPLARLDPKSSASASSATGAYEVFAQCAKSIIHNHMHLFKTEDKYY